MTRPPIYTGTMKRAPVRRREPSQDTRAAVRDLYERLAQLPDPGGEMVLGAVLLLAPGGKTFRVRVSDAGALVIEEVART